MRTTVIQRDQVKGLVDTICRRPTYVFSVTCERRQPLYLRYDPIDQLTNGPLAYIGDASRLSDHRRVRFCSCGGKQHKTGFDRWVLSNAHSKVCKWCKAKREKFILEDAGTLRTMIVKGKNDNKPMKHWEPKGGELPFDPVEHDLMLVAGMYADTPARNYGCGKRLARHGQWRPWAMICLRTVSTIKWSRQKFLVRG